MSLSRTSCISNGKDTPAIKLSGKWLREAGFNTGTGLTVKIAGDCIVLIPDNPHEQALREQLAQVKGVLSQIKQDILS
ncbi:SymE family type I addiction module toxin [Brenneria sp. L3-3Z]|uniref:SymE family type I addiction module toxin n=1 Tax=Brenneria sp. L3-3Z TaxID=3094864 RepID=UPI0029CA0462|nr:SymE family type I addiction module toxin [Brenneria sp. L3-3Z]